MIFVESACGNARHSCYNFCLVYAWISKQFGTVVALEEEKCLFKHFSGKLKVKVTLEGHIN